MSTQIVPVKDKIATIAAVLDRYRPELSAILGKTMTPDRLLQIKLLCMRNLALADCTIESWVRVMFEAATVGLEPDGVMGRAFVIPYKQEATFQLGYQGVLELARRSEEVLDVDAFVIREKDHFEYELGDTPRIVHRPARGEEAGPVIGAYAVMRMRNGNIRRRVMWKYEIEKHRRAGRAPDSLMWVSFYEAGCQKTVLKAICKYAPKSTAAAAALAIDEAQELGLPSPIAVPELTETGESVGARKSKLDQAVEQAQRPVTEEKPKGQPAKALEETPPVESQAAPVVPAQPQGDPEVEGARQPLGTTAPRPPAQGGLLPPAEPSPLEQEWIAVRERQEAVGLSDAKLTLLIRKTWPSTNGLPKNLTLLMVQNLAMTLRQLGQEQRHE